MLEGELDVEGALLDDVVDLAFHSRVISDYDLIVYLFYILCI